MVKINRILCLTKFYRLLDISKGRGKNIPRQNYLVITLNQKQDKDYLIQIVYFYMKLYRKDIFGKQRHLIPFKQIRHVYRVIETHIYRV